jgi:hypothetical protein
MHDVLRGVDGLATLGPRAVGPAYKGMIDQAKASTEFGLGGVVVLVTTGAPEDCSPSSYADLAAMATDAATSQPMVRTAVIGPADLPGPYDDVARAGLTDHAYRVSGGAQDARGAAQFLLSLDKDWGACEFDISLPGTGEPLDPAPLALTQSSMKGTTSEIPQVASSDACGNARGWYADYNTAMLCAKSCSENQANVVTAVYGCHSIGQTH